MALPLDLPITRRRTLTIYEIRVLLHYYAQADDHPDYHAKPPIWSPTISWCMEVDLIREKPDNDHVKYMIAPRGQLYVEGLMTIPLPEAVWMMQFPDEPLFTKRDASEG